MNQSQEINELASALAKAQGEMQAAIKDCINPFYKSKYADLGSVWDAARPVLSKNGLCVMQTTEVSSIAGEVVMVTTLAHTSGQWVKSYMPLNPAKKDSQGMGAAMTYLRRYSLSALVGVVCDEDDDGEIAVGRNPTQQKAVQENISDIRRISPSQAGELKFIISKCNEGYLNKILKHFNINAIEELPVSEFEVVKSKANAAQEKIKAVA